MQPALAAVLGSFTISVAAQAGTVLHVDDDAPGGGDGLTWTTPYADLQDAIAHARGAGGAIAEIRVAGGVYVPSEERTPGDARSVSFDLVDGVAYRGGFAGFGASDPDVQDPALYESVLSGDVLGDDGPDYANTGDNAYHVLVFVGFNLDAAIEAFTIAGGNASGTELDDRRGAGIYTAGGPNTLAIDTCVFVANQCDLDGSALYGFAGQEEDIDITVDDCLFTDNLARATGATGGTFHTSLCWVQMRSTTFSDNVSMGDAGAMYMSGPRSGPVATDIVIADCMFLNNTATGNAGAVFLKDIGRENISAPFVGFPVDRCRFEGNVAGGEGGGLVARDCQLNLRSCDFVANQANDVGGGAQIIPQQHTPVAVTSCRFLGNVVMASDGGGLFIYRRKTTEIGNCEFIGNHSGGDGGGLYCTDLPGTSPFDVSTCTFVANDAGGRGGGAYIRPNENGVANSVFWNNTDSAGSGEESQIDRPAGRVVSVRYSCIDGWTGTSVNIVGPGNIAADPLLVDADGADDVYGTDDDDARLGAGSPGIDAADNDAVVPDTVDLDGDGITTEPLPVDLLGNDRFSDDPDTPDTGLGTPPIVDMGAHEFGSASPPVQYVGPGGGDWFLAGNWSNGMVPDGTTSLEIDQHVVINAPGAEARDIEVLANGRITLSGTATLTARTVRLRSSGTIAMGGIGMTIEALLIDAGGDLQWTAGTIVVDGGQITSTVEFKVGCTGAATLVIRNGGQFVGPRITVCAAGELAVDGALIGAVYNGGLLRNDGPTARIAVDGPFNMQTSGTLRLELDDPRPGAVIELMTVTGNALATGALQVVAPVGWAHELGALYWLIDAANVFGSFGTMDIPSLPGSAEFIFTDEGPRLTLLAMIDATGPRLHVDADAPGGGDGQTWTTACRELQSALEVDTYFPGQVDEIWIADGVYLPTAQFPGSESRDVRFDISDGHVLYGGFAGGETDIAQRDWIANVATLSGDIGVPGDPSDNTDHVVLVEDDFGTVRIDGLRIAHGRANVNGGGMWAEGDPTIANCMFEDNEAAELGGGLYARAGRVTVEGCVFRNNFAGTRGGGCHTSQGDFIGCGFEQNTSDERGGGLYADGGGTVVVASVFSANTSARGGGLSSNGSIRVETSMFIANTASEFGGGMGNPASEAKTIIGCSFIGNVGVLGAGGLDNSGSNVSTNIGCVYLGNSAPYGAGLADAGLLTLVNGVFSGNTATGPGGGLRKYGQAATIVNSTFSENSAGQDAGGISSTSAVTIANSILWNNDLNGTEDESAQITASSLTIDYCIVDGWTGALGGTGNTGSDPQFLDPLGPDGTAGTVDDDLRVPTGSPAVDSGDNAAVPADTLDLDDDMNTAEPIPFDGDGMPRFADDVLTPDTGSGSPPLVDRGAYEVPATPPGFYIGPDGGRWFEASNWAGGAVPDAQTDVFIGVTVIIDMAGAEARLIEVNGGGALVLTDASLAAEAILVRAGGALRLLNATSDLLVSDLTVLAGATFEWNAGTVRLADGGTWSSLATPISVGCVNAATLTLGDGSRVVAPSVDVCALGTVGGGGVLEALVTNGGVVAPGASTGIINVDGSYVQTAAGLLSLEIEGYLAGSSYDRLVVTGAATLDGTLEVLALPGFMPELGGDQRLIVAAQFAGGAFAFADLPKLPGSFRFELFYDVTSDPLEAQTLQMVTSLFATGPRLYVNEAAAPGGNGQSWATATTSVRGALEIADLFAPDVEEVWIAAGSYTPDRGTGRREETFPICDGLAVYGGFAGDENDPSERDVDANPTTLDGDLGGDDGPGFANNDENSYTVVRIEGTDGGAPIRLDGLTVRGGNADGDGGPQRESIGGGVLAGNGTLTIANCRIESNAARIRGGGFAGGGTGMVVVDCEFVGNKSNEAAASTVPFDATFTDCLFEANEADNGGVVRATVNTDPTFERCVFRQNLGGGSGILVEGEFCDVTLIDCEFDQNGQDFGLAVVEIDTGSTLDATNCTFTGNMPVAISGPNLSLHGCTFDGNGPEGAVTAFDAGTIDGCTFTGNFGVFGGALRIWDHAVVNVATTDFTGNLATSYGGAVYVNPAGIVSFTGGSFSGNAAPDGTGVYSRVGIVRGSTTFLAGQSVVNGGVLQPGEPGPPPVAGVFTIGGTYDQGRAHDSRVAARLEVDVAGPVAGDDFDLITATSTLLRGGAVAVTLADGFMPALGQQFRVIDSPSVVGRFHVGVMSSLPDGQYLDVAYDAAGVLVSVEELDTVIEFEPVETDVLGGTPNDALLADADGDGDLDLITVIPDDGAGHRLSVLLNAGTDGKGMWLGFVGPPLETPLGGTPFRLAAGYFNGDASIDLAIDVEPPDVLVVLFNDADGSGGFTVDRTYPEVGRARSLDAASTPGDRAVDLLVSRTNEREVLHLVNDGTGTFSVGPQEFSAFPFPLDAKWADVNDDDFPDVVVLRDDPNEEDGIYVSVYDPGKGAFAEAAYYPVDFFAESIHVADLNDDRFPEILGRSPSLGTLAILLNEAAPEGTLAEVPTVLELGSELRQIAVTDFERDGDQDVATLVVDAMGDLRTRIVRNDQNGGEHMILSTALDLATGGEPLFLLTGDVDGDGLPDVVALNESPPVDGADAIGVLLNATIPACPEDLNGSGAVDFGDLIAVLSAWGSTGGPEDLDGSGVVDFGDLLRVLSSWGPCS